MICATHANPKPAKIPVGVVASTSEGSVMAEGKFAAMRGRGTIPAPRWLNGHVLSGQMALAWK
jgi:hypothetical protein